MARNQHLSDASMYDIELIKNIMETNDSIKYCENIECVEPLLIANGERSKFKICESVCQNLSNQHDNIIITFHDIDDIDRKSNLRLGFRINMQYRGLDVMPKYRGMDIMDSMNRHVFCMNIKNVKCLWRSLPIFLRQTVEEYEIFDKNESLIICLDNSDKIDCTNIVMRVLVE